MRMTMAKGTELGLAFCKRIVWAFEWARERHWPAIDSSARLSLYAMECWLEMSFALKTNQIKINKTFNSLQFSRETVKELNK